MALEQIGQKLKSARETNGLTLGQIFDRTKIPINHLQSIDNGLVDELPEPVYVAGYIKRYADCVGLNGQSLSDEYRRQTGSATGNGNKNNGGTGFTATRMVSQPVIMSAPASFRHSSEVRAPNFLKQGLWYVFLVIIVLCIMSFMFTWQNNNLASQDSTGLLLSGRQYRAINTAVVPNQLTQPGQTNQAATQTPTPPSPADNEASVSINANQHVWVEVSSVSTGQNLYNGFMERGERKDYKDPQGIRVHAGDGARLTVESNGKNESLGAPGKISEKVFMSKTAAATMTPAEAKEKAQAAAAAAKAALAATKKPVVKKPVNPDAALRRRAKAEETSGGSNASAGSRSVDVPYRYTESHDGD
jgi:cytoskeletal protein RodZ